MQVDASTLEWHDAGVDRIMYGDATRSMQWETEVFDGILETTVMLNQGCWYLKESSLSNPIMV